MALHYQTILSHFFFCPIPLALGHSSGTGKTTAVRCALSIVGAHPARFYSKGTTEKYADISAKSSLPFASDLVVALFNGAKATTIKQWRIQDFQKGGSMYSGKVDAGAKRPRDFGHAHF